MKPEKTVIILTLDSLDPKDHRLREKKLEAVGQGKEQMTDKVFRLMIGEHKARLANNDMRGNAKTGRAFTHNRDISGIRKKIIICWC